MSKQFFCSQHDSVISCEVCHGVFHGTLRDLAEKIKDHEIRGKLTEGRFKFDLIEYGEREPKYTLSKEWFGGRQEIARWIEVEPNHWVSEVISQRWDWID